MKTRRRMKTARSTKTTWSDYSTTLQEEWTNEDEEEGPTIDTMTSGFDPMESDNNDEKEEPVKRFEEEPMIDTRTDTTSTSNATRASDATRQFSNSKAPFHVQA